MSRTSSDIDYLDPKVVPPIPESVAKDSLYAYLEGQVGLTIAYATKEITVETATEEDRRYLKLPPGRSGRRGSQLQQFDRTPQSFSTRSHGTGQIVLSFMILLGGCRP